MKTITSTSPKSRMVMVDIINIGLMVLSVFLAVKIPFGIFIFSYALLGPLHYLTEISWLKQHNFYLKKSSHAYWLIGFSVVVVAVSWLSQLPWMANIHWFMEYGNGFSSAIYFIGFITAVSLVVFEKPSNRAALIIIAAMLSVLLYKQALYLLVFGVLLSTLAHVSLFTFAFILLGSLKSKSVAGYLSLVVYFFCLLIIFFIPVGNHEYHLSEYEYNTFIKSTFQNLHIALVSFYNPPAPRQYNLLSETALRIQFFIAFSYIYHYLNWFSKVEIIKWHKAPGNTFLYIIIIWIMAVALYLYDYKYGLMGLLLLSIIHVFLEFPLNFITFKNITHAALGIIKKP